MEFVRLRMYCYTHRQRVCCDIRMLIYIFKLLSLDKSITQQISKTVIIHWLFKT